MRARKPEAVRNEARGIWVFFPVIDGKRTTRKLGNLNELNQQPADVRAADTLRSLKLKAKRNAPRCHGLWSNIEQRRCPSYVTARNQSLSCGSRSTFFIDGEQPITELQPRPVRLWLEPLPLAPKTRGHLRDLLHRLMDDAMWANPSQRERTPSSSSPCADPRSVIVGMRKQRLLYELVRNTGP